MEGEGLFRIYRYGRSNAYRVRSQARGIGIGAAEGVLEGILRGFEWFLLCL